MRTDVRELIANKPWGANKPGLHACDPAESGYLNLALGESPYGVAVGVRAVLEKAIRGNLAYPDSSCWALREVIAELNNVEVDNVFVGNGIDELILLCALAFSKGERPTLYSECTFAGYQTVVPLVGGTSVETRLRGYRVDANDIADALASSPAAWFLCNPHNPTGTILAKGALEGLLRIAKDHGVVSIIDEAYAEYADPTSFQSAIPLTKYYPNTVTLRTLSKIYGLAGLRCGYAIADVELINRISLAKGPLPFNVNRIAQVAAIEALKDQQFVESCRKMTDSAKDFLYEQLSALGVYFSPSATNFVLIDAGESARFIAEELKGRHRILVRQADGFGFVNHLRVTVGTIADMRRVVNALKDLIGVRSDCNRRAAHG
jgi:histidinol-phosphate aminotransferase